MTERTQKVYIETTVISYLAAPNSRDAVTSGRQIITREWWRTERSKFTLMVSEVVAAECGQGDPSLVRRRMALLAAISPSPFRVNDAMLELAKLLVVPGAVPENAAADAVHIAAAAVKDCDFLLTWNLRHLANVRIRRQVERF